MRKTTKSVQRPNPKYRTTFDSAMPLSYIASHYPDVRKCKSGISNPRPGLTPGTALRAVGSGIIQIVLTSLFQKILIHGKAFKVVAWYYMSANVFTTIFEIYTRVLALKPTSLDFDNVDTHFTTRNNKCHILYFVLNDYVRT